MNLSPQEITAEIFTLQEEDRRQVFDFIEFLKTKSARQQAKRLLSVTEEMQQTEGEKLLAVLQKNRIFR